MTSNMCWQDVLNQKLKQLLKESRSPRVAVLGVGNEFRGDDGAGIAVIRQLNQNNYPNESILLVEAGLAPENCCAVLRRFMPQLVVMVDSAYLDQKPGTVCWLTWDETCGSGFSTHTFPLQMISSYFMKELNCECWLLGIQPADVSYGEQITLAVSQAVDEIAATLAKLLLKMDDHTLKVPATHIIQCIY